MKPTLTLMQAGRRATAAGRGIHCSILRVPAAEVSAFAQSPVAQAALVDSLDERARLDLDGNWDFVHFALMGCIAEDTTGTGADPLAFIADEGLGTEVAPDLGLGRPRLFVGDEVRAIVRGLSELRDVVESRLDSAEIAECYPCAGAVERLDDVEREVIRALVAEVSGAIRAYAAAGDGFVVCTYLPNTND